MIRQLARQLTAFDDFADFVIIEITLRRGNFNSTAEIVKNHASMAVLRATSNDAELLVKMIRPRTDIKPAIGCRIQSRENIWRTFTASEIGDFAASVGDKNPIHQLNLPIVPACLILEAICAAFPDQSVKLKFKNFVTAGEPLNLHRHGNKFELTCAGVRKVLGEFL